MIGSESTLVPALPFDEIDVLIVERGGNALGIGIVDFIPASLANQLDFRKTFINCFTTGPAGMRRARMPMVLPDETSCIKAALAMCGRGPDEAKRVVRIESTLHPVFDRNDVLSEVIAMDERSCYRSIQLQRPPPSHAIATPGRSTIRRSRRCITTGVSDHQVGPHLRPYVGVGGRQSRTRQDVAAAYLVLGR